MGFMPPAMTKNFCCSKSSLNRVVIRLRSAMVILLASMTIQGYHSTFTSKVTTVIGTFLLVFVLWPLGRVIALGFGTSDGQVWRGGALALVWVSLERSADGAHAWHHWCGPHGHNARPEPDGGRARPSHGRGRRGPGQGRDPGSPGQRESISQCRGASR